MIDSLQRLYLWIQHGIQAFILKLFFYWAAPSQWLSMLKVLEVTRSCKPWNYSKWQLWLNSSPPTWPRLDQDCSAYEEALPFLSPLTYVRLPSWSEYAPCLNLSPFIIHRLFPQWIPHTHPFAFVTRGPKLTQPYSHYSGSWHVVLDFLSKNFVPICTPTAV